MFMRRTYSNRVSSFPRHRLAIGKERETERESDSEIFSRDSPSSERRVERNAWRASLVVMNDPVSPDGRLNSGERRNCYINVRKSSRTFREVADVARTLELIHVYAHLCKLLNKYVLYSNTRR